MLTEEQIKRALHADRVAPHGVLDPHGPLGLDQLAETVSRIVSLQPVLRVERQIALPIETWQKLDELARDASQTRLQAVSAADVAAAILERVVAPSKQ